MENSLAYFWNTELNPLLVRAIQGTYELTKVQKRLNDLVAKINIRYRGQPINFKVFTCKASDDPGKDNVIPFATSCQQGSPTVHLYLPTLQEQFLGLQSWANLDFVRSQRVWESYVISHLAHEFDHFAMGLVGTRDMSIEELINTERQVWAETCEHMMRLFREVYSWELSPFCLVFYKPWVQCGRDAKSQQWKDFIAGLYGKLKRV